MGSSRLITTLLLYLDPNTNPDAGPSPPDFGICVRPGNTSTAVFSTWGTIPASRMLFYFLSCALDQRAVANSIYLDLKKIANLDYHATLITIENTEHSPESIASQLRMQPLTPAEARPARNRACDVFGHLCIGLYNPGGKSKDTSMAPSPGPEEEASQTENISHASRG
ncbi:hypothetical protein FRB95_001182 [Tulasnella sp. JGI-2019a]|nr:hypothetical protein FRB93_008928 [Tulasnella sp. JGI-2019a]KAG9032596.1 hypothetical protein FRB95_001182 [Tulasnella sp. JGI-2019a]